MSVLKEAPPTAGAYLVGVVAPAIRTDGTERDAVYDAGVVGVGSSREAREILGVGARRPSKGRERARRNATHAAFERVMPRVRQRGAGLPLSPRRRHGVSEWYRS